MKRIIKNYHTLDPELRRLVLSRYPDGIGNTNLFRIRDQKGNSLSVLEFSTADTIYLLKMLPNPDLDPDLEDFDDDQDGHDDSGYGREADIYDA